MRSILFLVFSLISLATSSAFAESMIKDDKVRVYHFTNRDIPPAHIMFVGFDEDKTGPNELFFNGRKNQPLMPWWDGMVGVSYGSMHIGSDAAKAVRVRYATTLNGYMNDGMLPNDFKAEISALVASTDSARKSHFSQQTIGIVDYLPCACDERLVFNWKLGAGLGHVSLPASSRTNLGLAYGVGVNYEMAHIQGKLLSVTLAVDGITGADVGAVSTIGVDFHF